MRTCRSLTITLPTSHLPPPTLPTPPPIPQRIGYLPLSTLESRHSPIQNSPNHLMHSAFVRLWARFVRPLKEQPSSAAARLESVLASLATPRAPPAPTTLSEPFKGTNCHPWHHILLVSSGLVDPEPSPKPSPTPSPKPRSPPRSPKPPKANGLARGEFGLPVGAMALAMTDNDGEDPLVDAPPTPPAPGSTDAPATTADGASGEQPGTPSRKKKGGRSPGQSPRNTPNRSNRAKNDGSRCVGDHTDTHTHTHTHTYTYTRAHTHMHTAQFVASRGQPVRAGATSSLSPSSPLPPLFSLFQGTTRTTHGPSPLNPLIGFWRCWSTRTPSHPL